MVYLYQRERKRYQTMKYEGKTVREFIEELEVLAKKYGDDMPVCLYDDYTADEGYDYKLGELYLIPEPNAYAPDEDEVEEGAPAKCILIR
jgi:hypothetical protein